MDQRELVLFFSSFLLFHSIFFSEFLSRFQAQIIFSMKLKLFVPSFLLLFCISIFNLLIYVGMFSVPTVRCTMSIHAKHFNIFFNKMSMEMKIIFCVFHLFDDECNYHIFFFFQIEISIIIRLNCRIVISIAIFLHWVMKNVAKKWKYSENYGNRNIWSM